MNMLPTVADMLKILAPVVISGVLAAIGMYFQIQSMKEANAADRAQQAQTLYRIENKVEKIDDSVRTIENKVTGLEANATAQDRRLTQIERGR